MYYLKNALFLCLLLGFRLISAQENPQPIIEAHYTEEKIVVDGQFNEQIWQSITPKTDFKQRQPAEGQLSTERSELRVAYDKDNLYFALSFFDKEPNLIRANIFDRGGRIDKDDNVRIGLDTYYDRRNGYIFEMNPMGTQDDALISDEKDLNWDWNGVYYSEGRITKDGWMLEVKIPFKTIRFSNEDELVMGIAVARIINRKNEEVTWPFIPAKYRQGITMPSQYAKLVGLKNINRGRNLQIKPYVIAGTQKNISAATQTHTTELVRSAGVDVKYGISSNLTLDLTYNTDFAQVEADAAQINLTRFNLFLPEKREFFLERNGLFQFGNARETEAFFSRNIGISNDILAGARVTGQAGPISVGLLNIQTKDEADQMGQNFAVARFKADVLPRASVGTIFTNVQNADGYNRVAGADANIRFGATSQINAWYNAVWDSELAETKGAGNLTVTLQNDLYSTKVRYLSVEDDYDPELGFVQRTNIKRYETDLSYSPYISRTGEKKVRRLSFTTSGDYITNQAGELEATEIGASATVLFVKRDRVGASFSNAFERLVAPFAIRPNAIIPVGDYRTNNIVLTAITDPSRAFYVSSNVLRGGFYHGKRTLLQATTGYRFSKYLKMENALSYNIIDLPIENGRFDATTIGLTIQAATSRKLFANALLQYDNFSKRFRSNVRIDWIHTPGSDLFLVFNTGYLFTDKVTFAEDALQNRLGVAKLTYLFQL